jgi:hypothetical protein
MSIFGWQVQQHVGPAATATAAPRQIYDPIQGMHRDVPAVSWSSRVAAYQRVPAPPPKQPAGSVAYNSAAARLVGQSGSMGALLRDPPPPAQLSPRFVKSYREETVSDASPSTHLALSHAYNRRAFSRGAMRPEQSNFVSSYADSRRNYNENRQGSMRVPSGIAISSSSKYATPRSARGPGERYVPKAPTSTASDAIAMAATATPRGAAADDEFAAAFTRCQQHHTRSVSARSRPMTARACISEMAARVQSASTSRPLSARSATTSAGAAAAPVAAALRTFADGTTAMNVTTIRSGVEGASASRIADETRGAIDAFEDRLRASRGGGRRYIAASVTPDVPQM